MRVFFAAAIVVLVVQVVAAAQTTANLPRTADGKPNFWQVLNTAAWDIQDHTGQQGVPPGQGVVEGNEIPYQPQALAKKKDNYAKRMTDDPTEANCFLPGVPRATYMPYRIEIGEWTRSRRELKSKLQGFVPRPEDRSQTGDRSNYPTAVNYSAADRLRPRIDSLIT